MEAAASLNSGLRNEPSEAAAVPGEGNRHASASCPVFDDWSAPASANAMPDERLAQRIAAGEGLGTPVGAGEHASSSTNFTWRRDRSEVSLSLTSEGWLVVYSATGRLLGPPQIIHQARHRDATHAAWDFMSRVHLASRDQDEGLRAGRSAAQWIRSLPQWSGPGR